MDNVLYCKLYTNGEIMSLQLMLVKIYFIGQIGK